MMFHEKFQRVNVVSYSKNVGTIDLNEYIM